MAQAFSLPLMAPGGLRAVILGSGRLLGRSLPCKTVKASLLSAACGGTVEYSQTVPRAEAKGLEQLLKYVTGNIQVAIDAKAVVRRFTNSHKPRPNLLALTKSCGRASATTGNASMCRPFGLNSMTTFLGQKTTGDGLPTKKRMSLLPALPLTRLSNMTPTYEAVHL